MRVPSRILEGHDNKSTARAASKDASTITKTL